MMSGQGSPLPKIRTPILEILFFGTFTLVGVYILVLVVRQHGPIGVGVFVLILFAAPGGFGVYVGVRRLLWKREYTRVMGRPPW